jgi:hypothetical protein
MSGHTLYLRIADGAAVDEDEACRGGVLKDGYAIRHGGLFMRDGTLLPTIAAQDSQSGYEHRLSDAWRGDDDASLTADAKAVEVRRTRHGISESQARFEVSLSDAWRAPR